MHRNKNFDEKGYYYAVIDIGTSNTIVLIGKQSSDNKMEIIAKSSIHSTGVVRGDIRNTNDVVTCITRAVAAIKEEYGIKILESYVGLSGQHIKFMQKDGYVSVNNQEGEVTSDDVVRLSKEMNNIIISPGEAIIHILPQSYRIDDDSDVIEPIGMVGNRLNGMFNIVTGNNDRLSLIRRCLNRADIKMQTIIISSLAAAEAVLVDDAKELGVVVVDFGGGTTDVSIYHDKTMRFLGVIPIGGEMINKDIRAMGVLERLVEKLKIKFGHAISDDVDENQIIKLQGPSNEISQKDLAMVIEARIMDVIDKLSDMIKSAGYTDKLKGGIVLTGGSSKIKGIDRLFSHHFKCPVSIAKAGMYITNETKEMVDSVEYSTAVGLLLRATQIGAPSKLELDIDSTPIQPQQTFTRESQHTQQHTQHTQHTQQHAQHAQHTQHTQHTQQVPQKNTNNQYQTENQKTINNSTITPQTTEDDYTGAYNPDTTEKTIPKDTLWGRIKRFIGPDNDELEDNKI